MCQYPYPAAANLCVAGLAHGTDLRGLSALPPRIDGIPAPPLAERPKRGTCHRASSDDEPVSCRPRAVAHHIGGGDPLVFSPGSPDSIPSRLSGPHGPARHSHGSDARAFRCGVEVDRVCGAMQAPHSIDGVRARNSDCLSDCLAPPVSEAEPLAGSPRRRFHGSPMGDHGFSSRLPRWVEM